jgi:hypothetical protein
MTMDWLDWSNPVAVWWCFLVVVSTVNIALWLQLRSRFSITEPLVLLSAVYVLGCAFRSILPRADVQRICLFDTWLQHRGGAISRHRGRALLCHAVGHCPSRTR